MLILVDEKLNKYKKIFRCYLITTITLYMVFGSTGQGIAENNIGLELSYKAINVAIVIGVHYVFYKIFFEFFRNLIKRSENSWEIKKNSIKLLLNLTFVIAIFFILGDLVLITYSVDTVVKALLEINATTGIVMAAVKAKNICISENEYRNDKQKNTLDI